MRIVFYGRQQAGMICLLALMALGHKIIYVIPEDGILRNTAKKLKLKIGKLDCQYIKKLKPDLLVSVQGMKILGKDFLSLKCINAHACLRDYPGNNPIERLLKDGGKKASVGIHWMNEKPDGGKKISEKFISIKGKTEPEVYNELYQIYVQVLIDTLCRIKHQ